MLREVDAFPCAENQDGVSYVANRFEDFFGTELPKAHGWCRQRLFGRNKSLGPDVHTDGEVISFFDWGGPIPNIRGIKTWHNPFVIKFEIFVWCVCEQGQVYTSIAVLICKGGDAVNKKLLDSPDVLSPVDV